MRDLTKIYKALSDDSRLRVLNLLFEKECCVCEVMQAMEISQSKASRALSSLHNVGFLSFRKDGLWSLYSLDWEGMEENLKEILNAAKKGFEGNRQMEIDVDRLNKAERTGPGCAEKNTQQVVSQRG